MENKEVAIRLTGVKKMYKLGQIGGGSLQADLQSWWARVRGKEDPNTKIGTDQRLVGQTFMALNGIDLTVYKGEALGIIGGNGAGKSTMLKLLSRVTAPTEGRIQLYGRIASMLEVGTGFNGEMTGRENIYMNGAILGMSKAEIDAKMEDIIEFSEVREFIDTPVKRYSSGMYVKLAFSVAAHLDSEIMIMDEVLAVGDMAFQKKCLDKMRDAAKKEGRTVLYVSHNMNTIRQLCDRCIVLDKGKIVFEGDVEDAIAVYMGDIQEIKIDTVFSDIFHSDYRSGNIVRLEKLTMMDTEDCCYKSGSFIDFMLQINVIQSVDNIRLRFEIKYQDGSSTGTMFSADTFNFSVGKHMIYLQMNTTHLMPGRYSVDIVAFLNDEFGSDYFVDGVYPGLIFDIEDDLDTTTGLTWMHKFWGHTMLHEVKQKLK